MFLKRHAQSIAFALLFAIAGLSVGSRIVDAQVPDVRAQSQSLALATANASIVVPINYGIQMMLWQVVTGATVNAADRIIFESSPDGGATWQGAAVAQATIGTGSSTVALGSIAQGATFQPVALTTYTFYVPIGAQTQTRIRVSTNNPGDSAATVAYVGSVNPWSATMALDSNSFLNVTVHGSLPPQAQPSPLYTVPVHDAAPVQPSPIYTTQVNTPPPVPTDASGGLKIGTSTNVPVACISGCAGGAPGTPAPTASAGAPPTAAPPVVAQITCFVPAGAAPIVTGGNIVSALCDNAGNLLVKPVIISTPFPVTTPPPAPTNAPTALPTATAGYLPAVGAAPVVAYLTCINPASPNITAGNVGLVRCNSSGFLQTSTGAGSNFMGYVEVCGGGATSNCLIPAPQPTASAGAVPASTTLPVTAYGACQYVTGVIAVTAGNSIPCQSDVTGNQKVVVQGPLPTPAPASSAFAQVIATTAPIAISASGRPVLSGFFTNSNVTVTYCNIWNIAAASVILGTSVGLVSNLAVQPGQSMPFFTPTVQGVNFPTAISAGCTGSFGTAGTTMVTSGTTSISIFSP